MDKRIILKSAILLGGLMTPYAAFATGSGSATDNDGRFYVEAVPDDTTHGTVTGSGWYEFCTDAELVATPKEGYAFDGWSDGVQNSKRMVSGNFSGKALFTRAFRVSYAMAYSNGETRYDIVGEPFNEIVKYGEMPHAPESYACPDEDDEYGVNCFWNKEFSPVKEDVAYIFLVVKNKKQKEAEIEKIALQYIKDSVLLESSFQDVSKGSFPEVPRSFVCPEKTIDKFFECQWSTFVDDKSSTTVYKYIVTSYPRYYDVDVSAADPEAGKVCVSTDDGHSLCGAKVKLKFAYNTKIHIRSFANKGYYFDYWLPTREYQANFDVIMDNDYVFVARILKFASSATDSDSDIVKRDSDTVAQDTGFVESSSSTKNDHHSTHSSSSHGHFSHSSSSHGLSSHSSSSHKHKSLDGKRNNSFVAVQDQQSVHIVGCADASAGCPNAVFDIQGRVLKSNVDLDMREPRNDKLHSVKQAQLKSR